MRPELLWFIRSFIYSLIVIFNIFINNLRLAENKILSKSSDKNKRTTLFELTD